MKTFELRETIAEVRVTIDAADDLATEAQGTIEVKDGKTEAHHG